MCTKYMVYYDKGQMVIYLLEQHANIEAVTRCGATALHYAARWANKEVIKALINKGVKIDRLDSMGRSVLHHAVFRKIEMSDILLLIQAGADINVADQNGMTPLHLCCKTQNLQLAKLLLWNGALAKVLIVLCDKKLIN